MFSTLVSNIKTQTNIQIIIKILKFDYIILVNFGLSYFTIFYAYYIYICIVRSIHVRNINHNITFSGNFTMNYHSYEIVKRN